MSRFRDFWALLLSGLRRGRQDVYDTTRRSIVSPEAKAGAAAFALFWLIGLFAAAGPADAQAWAQARRWHPLWLAAFHLGTLLIHAGVGALWGLFLQNALDFYGTWRWTGRVFRTERARALAAAFGAVFLHGSILLWDIGSFPLLYQGQGLLYALGTHTPAWIRAGAMVALFSLVGAAAAANLLRRFALWIISFGRPTRVAIGALGVFLLLAALGVRGVFRFQAPRNTGPNLVVVIVDGLRGASLAGVGAPPHLRALARSGRTFSSAVPPMAEPEGTLASFFFAAPPFIHGVRGPQPSEGVLRAAPASLPALLKSRDYRTLLISDAGGDFFTRLAPDWDVLRAPHDTRRGLLARGVLRGSVHLLPYLSGRWGRALFPALRGLPALADPRRLGEEASRLLAGLRFRGRFFLTVHMASLSQAADQRAYQSRLGAVDEAVGQIAEAVRRYNLSDQTWIVLWSPRGAAWTAEEVAAAARLSGPVFFDAPFVVVAPHLRGGARRFDEPLRVQDLAPGLLKELGLPTPERSVNAEPPHPWGLPGAVVYAETADPVDAMFSLPGARFVEDRDAPGRLTLDPAFLDRALVGKRRMVQSGPDRLVYTPGPDGVRFEYYRLDADPLALNDLAGSRVWAAHLREVKDLFYRYLAREGGWRPQNDYWLPEALLREEPHE